MHGPPAGDPHRPVRYPNETQQAMIHPPRTSSVSLGWKNPSTLVSELPTPWARAASTALHTAE